MALCYAPLAPGFLACTLLNVAMRRAYTPCTSDQGPSGADAARDPATAPSPFTKAIGADRRIALDLSTPLLTISTTSSLPRR